MEYNGKSRKFDVLLEEKAAGLDGAPDMELWTCLNKDRRGQQFYKGQGQSLDIASYMAMVQEKLDANQVPARIQPARVCWDGEDAAQEIYMVQPETRIVNPLPCLLQFIHIGAYTFVEEKTFILPPSLPGAAGTAKEREEAWEEWRCSAFLHSFQEETNGRLGLIFDAVFSCVKELNGELFEGCCVREVDETMDMAKLEWLAGKAMKGWINRDSMMREAGKD